MRRGSGLVELLEETGAVLDEVMNVLLVDVPEFLGTETAGPMKKKRAGKKKKAGTRNEKILSSVTIVNAKAVEKPTQGMGLLRQIYATAHTAWTYVQ